MDDRSVTDAENGGTRAKQVKPRKPDQPQGLDFITHFL
jgi:hypothetical protein